MRRLAALGGAPQDRLRLSKAEARRLEQMQAAIAAMTGAGEMGYRLGFDIARDVLLLRAALFETPMSEADLAAAKAGAAAQFPIKAADLMPALSGAALGARLEALKTLWIASGFAMDRAALLAS